MTKEGTTQTKWEKTYNKEMSTAKFLKAGTRVTIDPKAGDPLETTIDGKYGKRRMFIIATTSHGLVYVSPVQFMNIANALSLTDYQNITELEL